MGKRVIGLNLPDSDVVSVPSDELETSYGK